MLQELVVENFAVVERLRLRFHDGLNVLTGETGSGKSLIVDALGLLLGARASAEMIRSGAGRAFVSGIFDLPASPQLAAWLEEAGIQPENDEILVEREILASGKSRAFLSSRPVTAAVLKDLAPYLADIHGQHDQQRLFGGEAQRELLDEAFDSAALLDATASAWETWQETRRELEQLNRNEQEALRLYEIWEARKKEIGALGLRPGEDIELENESRVLRNVSRLQENAAAALNALSDGDMAASGQLALALKRVEELARIDEGLSAQATALRTAKIAVDEVTLELTSYMDRLEADPARLEEVQARLARIEKLKRVHGPAIEDILAVYEDACAAIDAYDHKNERRAELEAELAKREQAYLETAARLTKARISAASKLAKNLERELGTLAMAGARFRITVVPSSPSAAGSDAVEFLISANAGEEPRPLDKVASGGELSRIALALKTSVLGGARRESGPPRTLVFDEVDAGVGGAAAETVGRRLKQISLQNQVLCVTHLAQIAAFADHHYVVSKAEAAGRTVSHVKELVGDERIREVGRMLSGRKLSDEALRHAEKLIEDYAKGSA